MTTGSPAGNVEINPQDLWAKYEDIAMHFNDLIMRLRTQSLAGIAAVSTLVGLFTKEGADIQTDWLVASAIFIAMALFWIAIWCLDFHYYSRLLAGAVAALKKLENETASGNVARIDISTIIEAEFENPSPKPKSSSSGALAFYRIVLLVIVAGAAFSGWMHWSLTKTSHPENDPRREINLSIRDSTADTPRQTASNDDGTGEIYVEKGQRPPPSASSTALTSRPQSPPPARAETSRPAAAEAGPPPPPA